MIPRNERPGVWYKNLEHNAGRLLKVCGSILRPVGFEGRSGMELYSRSCRGKSMVRKRGTLGRKYRTYKLFRCCITASCVQPLTLPTAAVHGLAHRGQDPNSAAHPCAYHCGKGAQSCFRWSRDWLPIRCKSSATYLLSQRFKSPADFMQATSGQCHNPSLPSSPLTSPHGQHQSLEGT